MPMSVLLTLIPAVLLFLLAIMLMRTARFTRPPYTYPPLPLPKCEADIAAEHLAEALRFRTITLTNQPPPEPEAFTAFHAWLEQRYPRVHASLERLRFGHYSQLYIWHGKNSELAPVLFSAHLDVVPADEGLASGWRYPPFEGVIADGAVWGRGALDMKGSLVAIFEAVEHLLREGYQPERTIYLALGEDEEIRGQRGAAQIATWLAEQGIHPLAVLDEGGAVTEGMVRGIHGPIALIGVSEKGFAVLHLKAEGESGHAALPPQDNAISLLARALTRLGAQPLPARLEHIRHLFAAVGSAASPTSQFLLANTWLFGPWLTRRLSRDPRTNALIRTTLTPTLIRGGVKENVLPPQAEAWLNARILPGENPITVLEHVRRVVDDPNIQIEIVPGAAWAPSPVSPTHTPTYQALHQVITSVYPHALVAPYLMVMASDARYYAQICPQVYRFIPYALTPTDLEGIHGTNEHLSIENLGRMIQFYVLLMRVWGQSDLTYRE
jgi:carboxypeptidase PM20D1